MENGQNHIKKRSHYMPKLCSSTSIKDVYLPKLSRHASSSSSSSSSFNDPSSPRVTCMGKIKKDAAFSNILNHYKIIAAPSTARAAMCHKLKGNYIRKNNKGYIGVTLREAVEDNRSARGYKCHLTVPEVNISKMDPPLPVIKRVKDPGFDREEVNLWKRRSEFLSKTLELDHIHVPKVCYPLYESGKEIQPSLHIPYCVKSNTK